MKTRIFLKTNSGNNSSSKSTSSKPDDTKEKSKDQEGKKEKNKADIKCHGCGRKGHMRKECICANHPDYNKSNDKWSDSSNGKAWLANPAKSKVLPVRKTLSGEPLSQEYLDKLGKSQNKDLTCPICLDLYVIANKTAINSDLIPASLLYNKHVYNANILTTEHYRATISKRR